MDQLELVFPIACVGVSVFTRPHPFTVNPNNNGASKVCFFSKFLFKVNF